MSIGVLRCISAVLRPCCGCARGSVSVLIVTVFFTRLPKFVLDCGAPALYSGSSILNISTKKSVNLSWVFSYFIPSIQANPGELFHIS